MAFAFTTAVAGAGTVSCAGTTTVTGTGTTFATLTGSAAGANHARVGGTITVAGVTKTIVAIASTTSLTVDSAFGTFTNSAFTVATGVTQTGTDTMSTSLGVITGFNVTNRGDLLRTFDCRGLDLFINGTLTVDSTVAQLRNDGSCNNAITITGSVNGGELIINGQKSVANNGPFPYAGFDWLGTNGLKIMQLASTNATYPAKFTIIDACVRYGADWVTTNLNNFSRITTQGEECWVLCGKGTGTGQARLRQDNTTASIDFQATQTWVGVWLNFGVPQISLKGYTPIYTDGPELNLGAVSVATRIPIENYNTTYVTPAYYAGVQFVMLGGGWVRLKNNLVGTNIAWRAASASGRNILEFSKQIKAISKDSLGNVLNDGYLYFQPVGTNVAGIRPRGVTTDVTFDLSQQNILVSGGFATTEFVYAWDYKNVDGNYNIYSYFCSGTTKGAETHPAYLTRYGYDKQPLTLTLSGNNTFEVTAVHASLPTTDKVIANAAAITGVNINFANKTITVTGTPTIQQIYDVYQYQLNQTANLTYANECVINGKETRYVGWNIVVYPGANIQTSTAFNLIYANIITLVDSATMPYLFNAGGVLQPTGVLLPNTVLGVLDTYTGTGSITALYETLVGVSTIWEFGSTAEPIIAGTSLAIYDSTGTTKYYNAVTTDGVYRYYIAPQSVGVTYTYAIERYGYKREEGTFPSNAGGILYYVPNYSDDVGITDTQLVAAGYSTLINTTQIYDATAYFRLSEPGIKLGQLVARDGTYLDFGTKSVIFKDDHTAIISVAGSVITYKSIIINETSKYNAMKATPPATVTANDTEQINVLIEDANGDSKLTILGGDNLGYELWKVPVATATDDYATGTLLTTLLTNTEVFRFIGVIGFDIIGRDVSSGVRRRTSMEKGSYSQSFYVGNQIQLATDAPQLIENNQKLDELILKIDTDLDVKVSTRLAAVDYDAPSLAEIEASTVLASRADLEIINQGVQDSSLFIPHTTDLP